MSKEIVVSSDADETRAAVLEDGKVVELYVERPLVHRAAGNIYLGRVENVLPGMQAAFVNIGLERNAFLYVDDADAVIDAEEGNGRRRVRRHRRRPGITELLQEGQSIAVQVVKEPLGTKGARVTTHITLPGRYLVLMPNLDYVGVSRRIAEAAERERLRRIARTIKPAGAGIIVRTVAEGQSEEDLVRDRDFLVRIWDRLRERARTSEPPALLHRDLGLVFRLVRDQFTEDVDRLVVDDREQYDRILELLEAYSPELKKRVHFHRRNTGSAFEAYDLDREIELALRRKVWLPSGGYLVIDQTEAFCIIDVNTGKYVGETSLEETVLRTNLEAAVEIARQLRLRDIGGIIVIDFIDMERASHRQKVLAALEEALRKDRTRTTVLGFTQLGLVEMTRKKVRPGLEAQLQRTCPYCEGTGRVLSEETVAARIRREIRRILRNSDAEAILVEANPRVASLLIGPGGSNLRELERSTGKWVFVRGSAELHVEAMNVKAVGTRAEVEAKACPVREGEILEVQVEEPHVTNPWDGIARVEGYVIDVEGAGTRVGERVRVEITKAFRTFARARLVGTPVTEPGAQAVT
ncbi:MAG: Rne/Rng family ribonuclease [Bacillota bacterium]|nr:Rne/Rng family ribonuclease [Bacillota bacterium]MDI7250069.1 Rne/Rng family ribonuclease [Bacillota bacterium]